MSRLERGLRDHLVIDALAEVEEVLERPSSLRARTISSAAAAAQALDRDQAEDDLAVLDGEVGLALLDVGRQTDLASRRASSMCSTMMSRLLLSSISLVSSAAMNSAV